MLDNPLQKDDLVVLSIYSYVDPHVLIQNLSPFFHNTFFMLYMMELYCDYAYVYSERQNGEDIV